MSEGLSPAQRSRLAATPPFSDLEPTLLADVAGSMEVVCLEAGEVVVRQGEAGDRLFVVLDGRLETVLERPGDVDQSLAEHGPGDVLGELALLTGGIRLATVRTTTPATLVALTTSALEQIAHAEPRFAAALAELGARRLRRSQLAVYLSRLFGLVDPDVLDDVEDAVEFVSLRTGEVLFHEGEGGDALYIVLGGRLRVSVQTADGAERVLNDVGRGETVGELALLTHAPRSATVYAVRDSELARVDHASFDRLAERYPEVVLQVTRVLGTRLQQIATASISRSSTPRTLVLVPAGSGVDGERVARALAGAMVTHAPTLLVTRRDAEAAVSGDSLRRASDDHPARIRLTRWLDEREAANEFVLFVADGTWTPWTEVAMRRADHLVIVADAAADPAPGELERRVAVECSGRAAPHRTLLLLHDRSVSEPGRTRPWLAARTVDDHLHVRPDLAADVERIGRILAGRAITLVLGGGGARGFAHVGVLRAMEELAIPVDMIGGTSMGAAMAATWAVGWTSAEILERAQDLFARLFDVTLPLVSVLAAGRIGRSLERAFGDRAIEDLWIPYFSVASNLSRAEQVVDRAGSLREAVRASISLPGVMPPVYRDGDLLVDGGLLNNVPVDVMRTLNEGGRVVAVDVSPAVDLASSAAFAPTLSGWRLMLGRLNPLHDPVRIPGIVDLLNRAAVLGSVYLRNQARTNRLADLYLQIPVQEWGLLDFGHSVAIERRGHERSIELLRDWWAGVGEEERSLTRDTTGEG